MVQEIEVSSLQRPQAEPGGLVDVVPAATVVVAAAAVVVAAVVEPTAVVVAAAAAVVVEAVLVAAVVVAEQSGNFNAMNPGPSLPVEVVRLVSPPGLMSSNKECSSTSG